MRLYVFTLIEIVLLGNRRVDSIKTEDNFQISSVAWRCVLLRVSCASVMLDCVEFKLYLGYKRRYRVTEWATPRVAKVMLWLLPFYTWHWFRFTVGYNYYYSVVYSLRWIWIFVRHILNVTRLNCFRFILSNSRMLSLFSSCAKSLLMYIM